MSGAEIMYPREKYLSVGESSRSRDWYLDPTSSRSVLENENEGYDHAGFLSAMTPVSKQTVFHSSGKFSSFNQLR